MTLLGSDKYKYCNHHHELTDKHQMLELNGENVVVNSDAVLLLQELNRLGLTTRTHHIAEGHPHAFLSIILDNVDIEIRDVYERDSSRTTYNGKKELLLRWSREE